MKNFWVFIFSVLVFTSCEKVIDLDLNEAESRIVVEAVLKDGPGNNSIKLSYTSAVYTDQSFDKISGADVRVTDKDGNEYIFPEDPYVPGFYTNPSFEVLPQNDYSLYINIGGEIITSQCHSFAKPEIDSIIYYASPFAVNEDTAHMVEYFSVDNVNEVNHYRLRIWINSEEQTDYYYIGNDDFINGQSYNAPFFGADAYKGDTVFIELITLDKANYTYLYTLSSNESNSTAPANPTSNLEGNAIGYFGAFSTDTMTVVIE
ncbi:MAG: DUF4249 domain-containing protein [Crocinitomicaceae bacterium]|nr:DUF4249 domain-containing protein [Crocinitomicaceae bacterium]